MYCLTCGIKINLFTLLKMQIQKTKNNNKTKKTNKTNKTRLTLKNVVILFTQPCDYRTNGIKKSASNAYWYYVSSNIWYTRYTSTFIMVLFFLNFIYVVLMNLIFKLANLQPVVRKSQLHLQGRGFYRMGLPYFRPQCYKPF